MVDLIPESVSTNMYYLVCHIIYHYGTAGSRMNISGCRITFIDEILSRIFSTGFNSLIYLLLRSATLDHLALPLFKRFKFAKLPRFRFAHCLSYPRRLERGPRIMLHKLRFTGAAPVGTRIVPLLQPSYAG
jgi:hypothetical protein